MTTRSPEVIFNEITQFISDSRVLLESGAFVQLAGLDDHVKMLCEALVGLSQDERLQHADRLQQLLWSLNDLEGTMVHYRDAMAEQIRGLNTHQKANVAYRTVESIDEEAISAKLYTAGQPDPDLMIRTSGEQRISNYLLWQLAYSELEFISVPWPEFTRERFAECLNEYAGRERRFGLTGAQVKP